MKKNGDNCCNQDIVEQPVNLTTLNARYAEHAISYIQAHDAPLVQHGQEKPPAPYFLYLAFAHMHVPHAYESNWTNSSTRKTIFGDALREVDHTIGRIVDAVDQSNSADSTLILMTADNGPWNVKCSLAGSQGPFLGAYAARQGKATGKFTVWEGGHRESAIAYWPARIKPAVSHVLASARDFMPTIAALAGATLPSTHVYDGMDLAPVLFHNASKHHPYLFHPGGSNLTVGRFGQYKVFWKATGSKVCGVEEGASEDASGFDWLMDDADTGPNLLVFDLLADPAEANSIVLPAAKIAEFNAIRDAVLLNISSTFHSTADYSQGVKNADKPCCDVSHVVCCCGDQLP